MLKQDEFKEKHIETAISFPDGQVHVTLKNIEDISHIDFEYEINSYLDLFLLASISEVLNYHHIQATVTIPCFFGQQSDRRFEDNGSFDLKIITNFVNSMKFYKIRIFHPHSDVVSALLDNVEVISNSILISKVIKDITTKNNIEEKDLILLSTDAGGYKSLAKTADSLKFKGQVLSASKYRDKDGKITTRLDCEIPKDSIVLIVDDLCVYGGTFINLSKLIDCKKMYLAISHLTVNNPNAMLEIIFSNIYTSICKKSSECTLSNLICYDPFNP